MEQIQPLTILLLIPFAWAMCVCGRQINRLICPALNAPDITPMERSAFGLSTGAIVASQGMLAIGLLGHLNQRAIYALFIVLALVGIAEFGPQISDIIKSLSALRSSGTKRILWMVGFTLIAFAALSGALLPPIS